MPARALSLLRCEFAALGCDIGPAAGKNPGGYLGDRWQDKATRDPGPDRRLVETVAARRTSASSLDGRSFRSTSMTRRASGASKRRTAGRRSHPATCPAAPTGIRERLLLAFPGDEALERADRKLCPGVQLRWSHDTNLVCIVPPGINPDTGRSLEWIVGLDDAPLAPFPTAWLERASAPTAGRPASEWVEKFCRDYVSGSGETHPATMSMAAYLVHKLGSGQLALELLLGWNQRRCHPPKPEREIRDQVLWAARREASSRQARQ